MKYLITFFFLFSLFNLNSQDLDLYEKKIFVSENDTLNYRILKPLNYDSTKQYPVHLFLHGAGERGNDNVSQLVHGSKLFLKKESREKYNSWVIFPQAPKHDWWGHGTPIYKNNPAMKQGVVPNQELVQIEMYMLTQLFNKLPIEVVEIDFPYFLDKQD